MQLDKMLRKEGKTVRDVYGGGEAEVLFQKYGSTSMMQEKAKVYYPQDAPLHKGSVIRYGDSHYLLTNRSDVESDVFYCSNCIKCNAAWDIGGTMVYLASGQLSSPTPGYGQITSSVSGAVSMQTADIDFMHEHLPIEAEVCAFGGIYKLINKFFLDQLCFLYFERGLYDASLEVALVYDGATTFEIGVHEFHPYVTYGTGYVPEAAFTFSSTDEAVAKASGYEISCLSKGTATIMVSSTGYIENGGTRKRYSLTENVDIEVADMTEYRISVLNDGNGGAGSNKATAREGDVIVLSAAPGSGYRFKEWEVVSGGIVVADDSFIMPANDVEVKAIFEESASQTFTVTVIDDGNGTGVASQTVAPEGTLITLGCNPNAGFQFKQWDVISGGVTITDNTFVMPANDVEVKVSFEAQPVDYSAEVTASTYTINMGGSYRILTMNVYDPDGSPVDLASYASNDFTWTAAIDGVDVTGDEAIIAWGEGAYDYQKKVRMVIEDTSYAEKVLTVRCRIESLGAEASADLTIGWF